MEWAYSSGMRFIQFRRSMHFSSCHFTPVQYSKNPLRKWKGFNLLDFFSPELYLSQGRAKEENFKWMSDRGFDFVRIPVKSTDIFLLHRINPKKTLL